MGWVMKISVDPKILRQLLSYDHETGKLTWLHRSQDLFKSPTQAIYWNPKWAGAEAFTSFDRYGYRQGTVLGNVMRGHRVCWAIYYGKWPKVIDHVNGVRDDNRIENLRSVTQKINCRNSRLSSDNTSGVSGISWCKSRNRWEAYINGPNGRIALGRFPKLTDAKLAREAAAAMHGYHENHGDSL